MNSNHLARAALILCLLISLPLHAEIEATDDGQPPPSGPPSALWEDAKTYVTAPIHWDTRDWLGFGGTLGAFALAHHYDSQVRDHFTRTLSPVQALNRKDSKELQDYLPAAGIFAGTWIYAHLINDADGRRESSNMIEAGAFSIVTTYALKFAAGRARPDETTDPDRWRSGGSSFPSLHVSIASAIGTVLAESGNDDYRWLRRTVGYGLTGFAAYERLKHNAHWLSDTVAGAAIGTSTAFFVQHRHERHLDDTAGGFAVVPVTHGAMLTWSRTLQ